MQVRRLWDGHDNDGGGDDDGGGGGDGGDDGDGDSGGDCESVMTIQWIGIFLVY